MTNLNNSKTKKKLEANLEDNLQKYLKSLVILDWDDTLFPTTWFNNIKNYLVFNKYENYFKVLDVLVSNFLEKILKMPNVKILIITNATVEWVKYTLNYITKTKLLISDNSIEIISAREQNQGIYLPEKWKENSFKTVGLEFIVKRKINNIISIGDSEFEYNALVNLYKIYSQQHQNIVFKTIKLIKYPTENNLIQELKTLIDNTEYIINKRKYLDLNIKIITPQPKNQ